MLAIRTAKTREKIVKIGLAGRILIIVLAFYLKSKGYFLHDTFRELTYILSPLGCLYITLFVKFIVTTGYQYPEQGPKLSRDYVGLGYYGLLLLNIAELALILYKALAPVQDPPLLTDDDFFYYIVLLESAFGILAGFYMAELFSDKAESTRD